MNLKKGMYLVGDSCSNLREQLKINSGVIAEKVINTGIDYFDNAYLPNHEWRDMADTEYKILSGPGQHKMFNTLGLGEIPDELKTLFKKIKLEECKTLFDVQPKFQENEELTLQLNNGLNKFLNQKSDAQKYHFHRITRSLPGMHTTTFHLHNKEHIKYTGLHIDQSTKFTPNTAYKSDNRISINISEESRYLYFVNLTLKQIYNDVKKHYQDLSVTSDNIVELFFSLYPDYPIIRIEVKPYQYYIAPTDNFIHDGSTLGNKKFDITMVFVGEFNNY
ncbi:hypothetical protein [Chryseobacterium shigense]|uniref:Uncharacterized protein n=1 Tax=Chryseobacterium shigense TaxID=297244 RepID=A0A841N7P5_9FLAO|nr:hypothetical protein [Chryseobacterium shigense]MBB6369518.1 hypothetical protein [Chryseobacterium shigense]